VSAYDISRLLYSLKAPQHREAYRADPEAYYRQYALAPEEQALLREPNWQGLIDAGVSIYLLTKLMATLGVDLLDIGAAMRGLTRDAFLLFLKEQAAQNRRYALLPE
jgi:hypothetical protein